MHIQRFVCYDIYLRTSVIVVFDWVNAFVWPIFPVELTPAICAYSETLIVMIYSKDFVIIALDCAYLF